MSSDGEVENSNDSHDAHHATLLEQELNPKHRYDVAASCNSISNAHNALDDSAKSIDKEKKRKHESVKPNSDVALVDDSAHYIAAVNKSVGNSIFDVQTALIADPAGQHFGIKTLSRKIPTDFATMAADTKSQEAYDQNAYEENMTLRTTAGYFNVFSDGGVDNSNFGDDDNDDERRANFWNCHYCYDWTPKSTDECYYCKAPQDFLDDIHQYEIGHDNDADLETETLGGAVHPRLLKEQW